MATSYIPTKQADLDLWGLNFDTKLTATPTAYGLVAADALIVHNAYTAFHAALVLAMDPATATTPVIMDKDAKMAAFVTVARLYAQRIAAWPDITDLLLAELGLTVPDAAVSPIPAPDTVPVIEILGATQNGHVLRWYDEATPTSRAKPETVVGMLLHRKVGTAPAATSEGASLVGIVTRNPYRIETGDLVSGQVATYFGRWFNAKGEIGPESAPASFVVASNRVAA
jgi:hypothetical protein